MRRTCNNDINRNRYFSNHTRNNNLVTPEFLMNQIWMQEDDASVVKIIELNSSSDSSKESNHNYSHAWSYVNNGRFDEQEDTHNTVHEEARTRRMNMGHHERVAAAYANQCYIDRGMQSNSFYETYDAEYDSVPINHQMNCFTIINNHLESETSTEETGDGVEVIELDKTEDENNWDHVYNDEVVTFEASKVPEKRTIWIYSYKNKRHLSENDFELVNIPSIDASSASTPISISDEEVKVDKDWTGTRIGSPIPATYIPRLNLSLVQTLSTVTEISEPTKLYSKDSHEVINIKPKNNWLTERNDTVDKIQKCNVVNWLALSPRERRRRSINTNSEITVLQQFKETEITYAEGNEQTERAPRSNRSSEKEASSVRVQVDIHANKNDVRKELLASTKNKPKPDKTTKIADIIPMKISFADADNDIDDHHAELDYTKKPSIQINAKCGKKAEITDPIEKLDCSNWIGEEMVEKEAPVYDYDLEHVEDVNVASSSSEEVINSASRRLWVRNLKLMKAPQWSEYLPITSSPPSLHFSLSLGSLDDKKSWFKRLTQCMKCCK